MKLAATFFALIVLLGGMARADVTVTDTKEGSHDTVGVGASMKFSDDKTPTHPPKPHKRHRQPKRANPDSAAMQKSVNQAGGSEPRAGVPDAKKTTSGNIDPLKGNDAGKQNQGSPDHTPGSTGTSGM